MGTSNGVRIFPDSSSSTTRIIGTEGRDSVVWDKTLQRYYFFIDGRRIVNTLGGDDIIGIDPDPYQASYYGDTGPVFVNAGAGDDEIFVRNRTNMPFFSRIKGGPGFDSLYIQGYSSADWTQKVRGAYLILEDSGSRTTFQVHRSIEEILPF